jgi:hypothetical protein
MRHRSAHPSYANTCAPYTPPMTRTHHAHDMHRSGDAQTRRESRRPRSALPAAYDGPFTIGSGGPRTATSPTRRSGEGNEAYRTIRTYHTWSDVSLTRDIPGNTTPRRRTARGPAPDTPHTAPGAPAPAAQSRRGPSRDGGATSHARPRLPISPPPRPYSRQLRRPRSRWSQTPHALMRLSRAATTPSPGPPRPLHRPPACERRRVRKKARLGRMANGMSPRKGSGRSGLTLVDV